VMTLQAANFNADRYDDLLIATGTNGNLSGIYLLWGGADGLTAGDLGSMDVSQAGHVVLASGTWQQALALGDLDGDNIVDLGLVRNGVVDVVASGDTPFADSNVDVVHLGGDGNDTLTGAVGRDWIAAGAGSDTVSGGAGNDTLIGGKGADLMIGDAGNDTYSFFAGDGQDIIRNNAVDETAEIDILRLGSGIQRDEIWLERIDDDLRLSVLGTTDSVTMEDWFSSPAARLDRIETADGDVLADDMVSDLVQAMAMHSKPDEPYHSVAESPADLLDALNLAWEEN